MKKKIIIIGSGCHAKSVIDILHDMKNIVIVGITSSSLPVGSFFSGYKVLGNDSILSEYAKKKGYYAAMGIGGYKDNDLRKKVYEDSVKAGIPFINVIHPSACISKTAKLGSAITIFRGVIINTEVIIGDNSIVATASSIDHETEIGNHVLVSAGVTIGGYTKIGNESLLALGSKVISGVKIGNKVLVAAGAVVVNDIADHKKVFGVPAKSK